MPLRIGITLGDPAGIGPEVIDKALASGQLRGDVVVRVIGERGQTTPGEATRVSAGLAFAALEEAARLANSDEIDAVVTGPVHKARMAEIGFHFPGQTEFFANRTGTSNYAMLLTAGAITVALVTTHIPLRDVPGTLTTPEIVRVGKLLADFLTRRGTQSPRIAVAGLNPHAGESGKIGREEIDIIRPAISELNQSPFTDHHSPVFDGPISPDTLFYHLARGKWDAALCMYHDQGLIPLKLHGFDQGVNVTLGLPYPRTSPDHGTAFEIAGKNLARPESMIAAINLAIELAS
ncbi:MAG: 4-hydroxythreonine-4-phosphate dehydrogenase PdxA [Chthoniobacterales bacterium]